MFPAPALAEVAAQPAAAPARILHVMSYHTPWRWTEGQLEGFKAGLGEVKAEYKVFELDTKRHSEARQKAERGKAARALVEQWAPHLIYTTDDDAQELVTQHYLNTPIVQIFSGVNKTPEQYGFDKANNVTGVVEHEHFAESVQLLKRVVPGMKRLVVVLDDAAMWGPVVERMKAAKLPPDVSIVAWETIRTYEEYKQRIAAYPQMADAIALIGIFNFKDAAGKNVPYQEVQRWTAENSSLPDLGFWVDRVHHGTLVAVTVSEREQGLAAGRLARQVLVDRKSPRDLPIQPTTKGAPVISLARANKLGIRVHSDLLLSTQVITRFDWDTK
ncbi:MAG: ABC transporter substrate binding protein [Azonexus sp.]|nr:ABC transporter substrate binding protein [Azonexus sp.]